MSLTNSGKPTNKAPRNSNFSKKALATKASEDAAVANSRQEANTLVSRAETLLKFAQGLYQPVADYKNATTNVIQAIHSADTGEDGEKVVDLLNAALSGVERLLSPWETLLIEALEAMERAKESEERIRQLRRPTQNLPTEILTHIFELYVSEDEGLPNDRSEVGTAHGTRPLRLTHVCRRWRQLAHSLPSIWRHHFLSLHLNPLPFDRLRHFARLSANKEPCLTILASKPVDLMEVTLDKLKLVYAGTLVFANLTCHFSVENASTMSRILSRIPPSRLLVLVHRSWAGGQSGIPPILLPIRFFPVVKTMVLQEVDAHWEAITWSPTALSQMALTSLSFISSTVAPPLWISYVLPNLTFLLYNAPKFTSQRVTPNKLISLPLLKDLSTTWRDLILWFPRWFTATPIQHLSISNFWPSPFSNAKIDDFRQTDFGDTVVHVTLLSLRGGDTEGISYFISHLALLDTLTLKGDTTDIMLSRLSNRPKRTLRKLRHLIVSDYDGTGESILRFVEHRGKVWQANSRTAVASLRHVEILDSPNVAMEMHQRIQRLVYEYSVRHIRSDISQTDRVEQD